MVVLEQLYLLLTNLELIMDSPEFIILILQLSFHIINLHLFLLTIILFFLKPLLQTEYLLFERLLVLVQLQVFHLHLIFKLVDP